MMPQILRGRRNTSEGFECDGGLELSIFVFLEQKDFKFLML
jgi:hypothetical protein